MLPKCCFKHDLICYFFLCSWEHFKPLLRYYEYSQGVEIHVASYPPVFEQDGPQPFNMTAPGVLGTCQFIAMEGATFVIVPTSLVSEKNREKAGAPAGAKRGG